MSNAFIDGIKKELDSEKEVGENGAVGYATHGGEGKCLVDFNFQISSMRGWDDQKIKDWYAKVYFENPRLAVKYWAFAADCRGGLGERRTSRLIFDWLVDNQLETAKKVLPLIPFYGRWDSLVNLIEKDVLRDAVAAIVKAQFVEDLTNCRAGKPFSLLAKWAPSCNTSSAATKARAVTLMNALDMMPRSYRKMLSELRAGLKVVERSMSAKQWSDIDYNAVPSKANILYRKAFLKNDKTRREDYLSRLEKGEDGVKINSSAAFPCDIVHSYVTSNGYWGISVKSDTDRTVEEMWKALPDYLKGSTRNILPIVDVSGSMTEQIGGTNMTAWEVAQSLGIYFSQHTCSAFKDKYLVFSSSPRFMDMTNCKTLHDRLVLAKSDTDCSNTNFAATLRLVLNTAVNNHLKQEDIPDLLVCSDLHFDGVSFNFNETLMDTIAKEYEAAGYDLHKIKFIWWNITGGSDRKAVLPMQVNEAGMVTLSGFSASLMDMVLSNELSPYKCLVAKLDSERYAKVDEVLGK